MVRRRSLYDHEKFVGGQRRLPVLVSCVELIESVVVSVGAMKLGNEVEPQRHPTCFVVMSLRYCLTYTVCYQVFIQMRPNAFKIPSSWQARSLGGPGAGPLPPNLFFVAPQ